MSRRRPVLRAKTSSPYQGDLFSYQGDLFSPGPESSEGERERRELWRKASALPQRPGEFTPRSLLGEAFLKVALEDNDPYWDGSRTDPASALRAVPPR